jgi:hypothetical protein
VEEGAPRFPLVRIMLGNATLLSLLYLVAAIAIEVVRRYFSTRWSEKASLAMESLPARALEMVGLLAPLKRSYVYGSMSEFMVRLIFGTTTVAIIFLMALLVGAGMWTIRMIWERQTKLPRSG